MKLQSASLVIVLFVLFSVSCVNKNQTPEMDEFDVVLYEPEYASGFDIKGSQGRQSSVITVTNPWQGADSVVTQLLISRNGEPVPDGFDGQVLEGDASRIVAMSSTHIAMLAASGADSLVVAASGLDFVNNPFIRANRDKIGDVGYDGNIDYELLVSLDPDIVLLYGINGASPMERKLKEIGIPYVYIGDYLEESPLGKSEWLVAVAEIAGRRLDGEKAFAGIPARYNAIRQTVADASLEPPVVMLNTPYRDSWFMPSVKSYFVRLITDAGGDYVYKDNNSNSSVPVDLEDAYMLTSQADVWLNTGMARSLAELRDACPKFADTKCFESGQVYNNVLRTNEFGGNDFYESGIVHPDLLLRDLVKIFHPQLVTDDFVYYKQLK